MKVSLQNAVMGQNGFRLQTHSENVLFLPPHLITCIDLSVACTEAKLGRQNLSSERSLRVRHEES